MGDVDRFESDDFDAEDSSNFVESLNMFAADVNETLDGLPYQLLSEEIVVKLGQYGLDGSWHLVGDTRDPQEPSFTNSWANYDVSEIDNTPTYMNIKFRQLPGRLVVLEGYAKSGTINTGTTGSMFTLPIGYRPKYSIQINCRVAAGGVEGQGSVHIDSSGRVRANVKDVAGALDWWSLSGISFIADDALTEAAFPLYVSVPFEPTDVKFAYIREFSANPQPFNTAPVPTWESTGDGRVKVTGISGCLSRTKYRMRFRILG